MGERWVRWGTKAVTLALSQKQSDLLEVAFREGLPKTQRPAIFVGSDPYFWGIRSLGSRGSLWISSGCFETLPSRGAEGRTLVLLDSTEHPVDDSTFNFTIFHYSLCDGIAEGWRKRFLPLCGTPSRKLFNQPRWGPGHSFGMDPLSDFSAPHPIASNGKPTVRGFPD